MAHWVSSAFSIIEGVHIVARALLDMSLMVWLYLPLIPGRRGKYFTCLTNFSCTRNASRGGGGGVNSKHPVDRICTRSGLNDFGSGPEHDLHLKPSQPPAGWEEKGKYRKETWEKRGRRGYWGNWYGLAISLAYPSGEEGGILLGNVPADIFCRLSCPPFLNRQGEILSPSPERLVSNSGPKTTPLLGSENRRYVILSDSFRNVSAALSLLNKFCNSIYSTQIISLAIAMPRGGGGVSTLWIAIVPDPDWTTMPDPSSDLD